MTRSAPDAFTETHPHLSLPYLLRRPIVETLHSPLLVLLHGYGSNEEDLFSLAAIIPPQFLVLSVRGPYVLTRGQYAWFQLDFSSGTMVHNREQAEKSRLRLKDLIDEVTQQFSVDMKNIFLVGFSQGAIMSASVAFTFPSLVSKIGMLSGRILEEIKPRVNGGETVPQLKVFLAHGTEDTVLPIAHAREGKAYLESLNVDLEYHEYPMPHTISSAEQEALVHWLSTTLSLCDS